MRQYYKIQRKSTDNSKYRMMLYKVETMIIQESINYTSIEDEYNNIQERFKKVQNIKNQIKKLDPEVVNGIIQNMMIVDYDQYISVINVSGKGMSPEAMKNAVANPPLHTGIYSSKGKYDVETKWSIMIC